MEPVLGARRPWVVVRDRAPGGPRAPRSAAARRAWPKETCCQPESSAQNAASRAGSALSSGSAAIGPDVEYSGRSSMTQNGLPSGSANTTQGTSRWPMSRWPRSERPGPAAPPRACREPPLMSGAPAARGATARAPLEAQIEHQPVGHGEPGLEQVGPSASAAAAEQRLPEATQRPGGPARRRRGSRGTCPDTYHAPRPASRPTSGPSADGLVSSRSDTLGHSVALKPAVRWWLVAVHDLPRRGDDLTRAFGQMTSVMSRCSRPQRGAAFLRGDQGGVQARGARTRRSRRPRRPGGAPRGTPARRRSATGTSSMTTIRAA